MFDFPASPAIGQVFNPSGGPLYTWNGLAWAAVAVPIGTADTRNRIVNGAMQISQENAAGTVLTASLSYPADQWQGQHTTTGALIYQQIVSTVYPFNRTRIRMLVSPTADTSIAAGEFAMLAQSIEGIRIADFMWGTALPKPAVIYLAMTCNVAGTYAVALRENAATPTYSIVFPFTVSASEALTGLIERTFAVPAPTAGTWVSDNTKALSLSVCFATGTTYQAPSNGVWVAGNFLGVAGHSNGLAAVNNELCIVRAGLYLDPNNTGLAPPWQPPDEAQELAACMRYWELIPGGSWFFSGNVNRDWILSWPISYGAEKSGSSDIRRDRWYASQLPQCGGDAWSRCRGS